MKNWSWFVFPLFWGCLALTASAQTSAVEVAILKKPYFASNSTLGGAVDLSGDTIVGGAHKENKAHVFRFAGGVWSHEAVLEPSELGGFAGLAVAVEGDVAAVGAPEHSHGGTAGSGAVWIFERTGTTWTEVAELNGAQGDFLGRSLAIRNGTIYAGAPADLLADLHFAVPGSTGIGSVWTIEKVGGVWTQTGTIQPSNPVAFDDFGFALAVDPGGTRLVVGAPADASKTGAVYVFDYDAVNGVWNQTHVIPGSAPGDLFGMGVDVRGDTVAAAAPGANNLAGQVFVLDLVSNTATALTPNVPKNTHLGETAVALRSSTGGAADELYVGGHWWSSNGGNLGGPGFGRGIAYAFRFDGSAWQEAYSFRGSDTANTYDNFGRCVAADGNRVVVGATGTDYGTHPNEGSLSVFEIAPQSAAAYGPSCTATGGCAPQLSASGSFQPGGSITLGITNGYGGQPAVLLIGTHPGALQLGSGCWVLLEPVLPLVLLLPPLQGNGPCVGTLQVPGLLPMVGDFWIGLQAAIGDPTKGTVLTNAVAIHLH